MESDLLWPPPYTIKHSARARFVRLKISKHNGLQLTLPIEFNLSEIRFILEKHRQWIERKWQRLDHVSTEKENSLPNEIKFLAIDQTYSISYISSPIPAPKIKIENNSIRVEGKIHHKKIIRTTLKKWVLKHASFIFPAWLKQISEQVNLNYERITIRDTKTRWGSCSAKKRISLSCKLLFLPPQLVEHVMIHELCHTVHLDHSEKFWGLVQLKDPLLKQNRKALKNANSFIPNWLD